jgi:hypothetical protein
MRYHPRMLFLLWLNEVRKEFRVLLTGSLLLGTLGLFQVLFTSAHVPRWVYLAIGAGFLVWAFFRTWAREYHANEIKFAASYSATPQTTAAGLPGVFQRIGITNKAPVLAQECELVISSFSVTVPGLSMDTPLNIKDADVRKGDINPRSTRHFDLFLTYQSPQTDWPHGTFVLAPNAPNIPWKEVKEVGIMVLKLTGRNFVPFTWRARIRLEGGEVEILSIEPLTAAK